MTEDMIYFIMTVAGLGLIFAVGKYNLMKVKK